MLLKLILKKIEQISIINEYESVDKLFTRYLIPLFSTVIIAGIILYVMIPQFKIVVLAFIFFGLIAVGVYPVSKLETKKRDIINNIHLFITYAGTISTMKVSRVMLFTKVSQKEIFGEISTTFQKILYLAKKWNFGFAKSCKRVSKLVPSQIFGDFLDRFAVMMDFGEDLESYLISEQNSVLDDYSTEYKKSLENIKMLQDVFVSLSMAVSFGVAIGLLIPLLLGISMNVVIIIAIVTLLFIDVIMMVAMKAIIPDDPMFCKLDIKNRKMRMLDYAVMIAYPPSFLIFIFFLLIVKLSFIFSLAIALIPLFIIGIMAKLEESYIARKDMTFPAFIRALGSATHIRSGALVTSLGLLRIHDFILLDEMVDNLYKRLKMGSERFKSWYYFSVECGSHLIYHFSKIFAEGVYMGGNAKKIGEIVSNNFQRLVSLRKLKAQQVSGIRGASYGSLIGLATVSFVSLEIVRLLSEVFSDTAELSGDFSIASILAVGSGGALEVNMAQAALAIGIMIIIHSVFSSILLKILDGGSMHAIYVDMNIMIFIGAVLSYFVPRIVSNLLGGIDAGI